MTWLELAENRDKNENEISDMKDDIAKHEVVIKLGAVADEFIEHVAQPQLSN